MVGPAERRADDGEYQERDVEPDAVLELLARCQGGREWGLGKRIVHARSSG